MTKSQNATLWMRATNSTWKRAIITICLVMAVPLLGYGIAEYAYQLRVHKLVNAMNQIGQNDLMPVGGISLGSAGVDAECRFAIDAFFAIDTGPCPRAGYDWEVPVEPGKEATFLTDTLRKEGYTVPDVSNLSGKPFQVGGVKDGVGITMEVSSNNSTQPSQAAPAGKQWLGVWITAVEVHR